MRKGGRETEEGEKGDIFLCLFYWFLLNSSKRAQIYFQRSVFDEEKDSTGWYTAGQGEAGWQSKWSTAEQGNQGFLFFFFLHMGLSLLSGSYKSMRFRSRGAGLATWCAFTGQLWFNFWKGLFLVFFHPLHKMDDYETMCRTKARFLAVFSSMLLYSVSSRAFIRFCTLLYRSAVLMSNQTK